MNHSSTYISTLKTSVKTLIFKGEKCLFGCRFSPSFSDCDSTGKELDEETGYGYFGARYYDPPLLTSWTAVDQMSDKYPNISPYAYCAWNPVKLIDPDGKEIDVSALYKKGRDGSYEYEFAVKAFEFFANTKIGRKELAKYAKSGQTIAGQTFTEDGKYHSKGIDLSFDCGKITNAGADGETGRILKKGRLKINITLSNVCNDGGGCVLETICHEVLMHAYHGSVDFADDGKLNNSDFSSRLRDYAKDGGMRQNYAEESKYSYRMKNFAVPILLDFFAGKKTRTDIIKLINSGIKYSKIK